jgi:cytochrome c
MRNALASALVLAATLSTPPGSAMTQATPQAKPATVDPLVARGKRLFMRCTACHDIGESKLVKIGPNLQGVLGRRVASLPGFAYSESLKSQSFTWDEARLSAWLEKPTAVAAGTNMVFEGFATEQDRLAVIAFLATQR